MQLVVHMSNAIVNSDHLHKWIADNSIRFHNNVNVVKCSICGVIGVMKPVVGSPRRATAINCFIVHKLFNTLGINCGVKLLDFIAPGGYSDHCMVVVSCVGVHSRVSKQLVLPGDCLWPDWLYYFDRWIGRIDGDGDSNLLYLKDINRVIPVDWGCSFVWVGWPVGKVYVRRVDDLDVPCHPAVVKCACRDVVKSIGNLSDDVIWRVVMDNMYREFVDGDVLTGIWSGLCCRRDLLVRS